LQEDGGGSYKERLHDNVVKGQILKYDLAQADRRSGRVLGGIAVEVHVK
jgi:hypothetical protein